MMMVTQEGVARTIQQLGSLMKTATLCRIQVPTYQGDLLNHGSLWLTSRILYVVFRLKFFTPQNLSSYMAVPFLDAVTDFCDDTEEHFHDQGQYPFLLFKQQNKKINDCLLIYRIAYKA